MARSRRHPWRRGYDKGYEDGYEFGMLDERERVVDMLHSEKLSYLQLAQGTSSQAEDDRKENEAIAEACAELIERVRKDHD